MTDAASSPTTRNSSFRAIQHVALLSIVGLPLILAAWMEPRASAVRSAMTAARSFLEKVVDGRIDHAVGATTGAPAKESIGGSAPANCDLREKRVYKLGFGKAEFAKTTIANSPAPSTVVHIDRARVVRQSVRCRLECGDERVAFDLILHGYSRPDSEEID